MQLPEAAQVVSTELMAGWVFDGTTGDGASTSQQVARISGPPIPDGQFASFSVVARGYDTSVDHLVPTVQVCEQGRRRGSTPTRPAPSRHRIWLPPPLNLRRRQSLSQPWRPQPIRCPWQSRLNRSLPPTRPRLTATPPWMPRLKRRVHHGPSSSPPWSPGPWRSATTWWFGHDARRRRKALLADAHRQLARTAHLAARPRDGGGVGQREVAAEALHPHVDGHLHLHAGQVGPGTAVDAQTEGGVAVYFAVDDHLVGICRTPRGHGWRPGTAAAPSRRPSSGSR